MATEISLDTVAAGQFQCWLILAFFMDEIGVLHMQDGREQLLNQE